MVRTRVQLTEQQAARLKERAAQEGVSLAEILRRGAELYLQAGGTVGEQERKDRAIGVLGRFRSGKKDLGEHHDKYLAEVYAK